MKQLEVKYKPIFQTYLPIFAVETVPPTVNHLVLF